MKIDQETWDLIQNHLGYNNEEMEIFKKDPKNEVVMSKAPGLMNKTIVFEVIESNGCNSQHKVGDKFYFDGAGNLLTKLCPKRICIYALEPMAKFIFASNELFYSGSDPDSIQFKRTTCFDVGIQCGGWGQIVMEGRVEDRKK
jgi:uncharacterized repeat protein (TIGR04076 family)